MNKALLDQLMRLTPAERMDLACDLWDSLLGQSDEPPPLTPEQIAEVERRLAEHERDPTRAQPWETVKERLLARYAK
ncbi:MAG: addiction module protein [Pseudolabrys sp.]